MGLDLPFSGGFGIGLRVALPSNILNSQRPYKK
jgi:hypothetical protein